jgi:uncharacterized damage-inducible protein DinB
MPEDIATLFLTFSADRLQLFSSRITDCLGRLSDDQIWSRGSENENAIGNLVIHLCGNVRQWIGSGVMKENDIRDRYSEFEAQGGQTGSELKAMLESTISRAVEGIRTLPHERLAEKITVQKMSTTVLQAIYAVVEHFSTHTGQIIFATKMLTHTDLGYFKHLNRPKTS